MSDFKLANDGVSIVNCSHDIVCRIKGSNEKQRADRAKFVLDAYNLQAHNERLRKVLEKFINITSSDTEMWKERVKKEAKAVLEEGKK